MATYYALTTLNEATNGWDIVAIGNDKTAVLEAAFEDIYQRNGSTPNAAWDIFTDTEVKNLRVVSKTVARRRFGITDWSLDAYYEHPETESAEPIGLRPVSGQADHADD